MIPKEDIGILLPAEQVRAAAKGAESILREISAATTINLAANTGETRVIWTGKLTPVLKLKLEKLGYTVKPVDGSADENSDNPTVWEFSCEAKEAE